MIKEEVKLAAKSVDMELVLDEFKWFVGWKGVMRCPNPDHEDNTPSCEFKKAENVCRCHACRKTYDTIATYKYLSEKAGGRAISFPKAVEEVLALEGSQNSGTGKSAGKALPNAITHKNKAAGGCDPYSVTVASSGRLTGYELEYLHGRGIMIYDSYVYGGEVKTAQGIDKELQTADEQEKERLEKFKRNGVFFKGIAPILRENKISILHNYYQNQNSIIYNVSYDGQNDDELWSDSFFDETSRRMAVQKGTKGSHMKKALGDADFNFITRGIDSRDIFICEGMEDALSFAVNGYRSISLNSTSNVHRLTDFLKNSYFPHNGERFVTCLDHDDAGARATEELLDFFKDYNSSPKYLKYKFGWCRFPQEFNDINDYWKAKVFGQTAGGA